MEPKGTRKLAIILSVIWGAIALILFLLALNKTIELRLFQNIFAGGFVVWVLAVTVLTKMSSDS